MEKRKKQNFIDTLYDDISKAEHVLAIINDQIKDKQKRASTSNSTYWMCMYRQAMRQIERLESDNRELRRGLQSQRLINEELLRYRTPDDYMDKVATALALLPITSISKICAETHLKPDTIRSASNKLKIKPSKSEREEARKRMVECGLEDIENRGGKNSSAVEMLVNGKVVATFKSKMEANRIITGIDVVRRLKASSTEIDGIVFRLKK